MLSNVWDEILGRTQFNELSDDKKKTALEHWYKMHGTGKIKDKLGFSDYQLYTLYDKLGVSYQKRVRKPNKQKSAAVKATPKPEVKQPEVKQQLLAFEEVEVKEVVAPDTFNRIMPIQNSGSTFYLDDILDSEEAISKLMKYAAFLEGEDNKFRLRVEISEIKK